jgi:hypothetical protein
VICCAHRSKQAHSVIFPNINKDGTTDSFNACRRGDGLHDNIAPFSRWVHRQRNIPYISDTIDKNESTPAGHCFDGVATSERR